MSEPLQSPEAVARLEQSVRADLASVRAAFEGGAALLAGLEECFRVLPDSRGALRNWRLQVEEICRQIDEEADAVTKKLFGTDATPPIAAVVDHDLAARVQLAKDEAA